MRSLRLFALTCLIYSACTSDDPVRRTDDPISRIDSSGVALVISSALLLDSVTAWKSDAAAFRYIADPAATDPPLYGVAGIAPLGKRNWLVVDGGSAQLRLFDADGVEVAQFGGRGNGPEEFGVPVLLRSFSAAPIMIYDPRRRRFSEFDLDGDEVISTLAVHRELRGTPLGEIRGKVLIRRDSFVGGEASLTREGMRRMAASFHWLDLESGQEVPLMKREFDSTFKTRRGLTVEVPFSARPSASVHPGGAFVTDGLYPEIMDFDLEGRLRRILRISDLPRDISQAMRDSVVALTAVTRADLVEMDGGEVLPAFDVLFGDHTGRLWARLFDPLGGKKLWVVFAASGEIQSTWLSPARFRLMGVRPYADVYGVQVDMNDVEHVRTFDLSPR